MKRMCLALLCFCAMACSKDKSEPSIKSLASDPTSAKMTPQFFGNDDDKNIPIVGLDENNQEQKTEISQKQYVDKTTIATTAVVDSLLPVLNNKDAAKPSKWGMRVVGVGIGITAEFGVGPVKVGVMPKMRLLFTNHSNPPLP